MLCMTNFVLERKAWSHNLQAIMIRANKSIPFLFGKITSSIFDEYTIYKCKISSELVNNYLLEKLCAFAEESYKNLAK